MNQVGAWTIGPCAANRHTITGPADAFPPACDGCVREAFERDAERYRYLRDIAGNRVMKRLMAECRPDEWDKLVDADRHDQSQSASAR